MKLEIHGTAGCAEFEPNNVNVLVVLSWGIKIFNTAVL